jgi:hypothetical protein
MNGDKTALFDAMTPRKSANSIKYIINMNAQFMFFSYSCEKNNKKAFRFDFPRVRFEIKLKYKVKLNSISLEMFLSSIETLNN